MSQSGIAGQLGKKTPFEEIRQEAYLNLVRTHEELAGQFARLFKQHGVSAPQYNVLRILRGEGKPMQIYQISERMVSPQTDISRLIDRLKGSGLIDRVRCEEDRRVAWVTLTKNGKTLLKKLDRPVMNLHKSQFGPLNDSEVKKLNNLLAKAREN